MTCKHEHGMCACMKEDKRGCGGDTNKCMCKAQVEPPTVYKNYTSFPINIVSEATVYYSVYYSRFFVEGDPIVLFTLPKCGKAYIETVYTGSDEDPFMFNRKVNIIGLPDPEDGVVYIVHQDVYTEARLAGRTDVVYPCHPIPYLIAHGYLGYTK